MAVREAVSFALMRFSIDCKSVSQPLEVADTGEDLSSASEVEKFGWLSGTLDVKSSQILGL